MAAAALPNAVTSNIVTRLRNRRDLETTMNTLKQLISSKTGSRKKNKPRSLAKKALPKKTTKRFENCSDDDGEYYPNNLKRNFKEKKTVLKPRHKLKVVVAMNKRKRVTPHKGLEQSPNICNQDKPQQDMNVHIAPSTTNVHTAPDLEIQTPPSSSNPDIYELISPPHKSLTQLTADDLIRMDEDSLSDEDLMEILTCPSPVWWEDPSINRGTVFLTSASEVQELKDTKKQTELKTYTNKKITGVQKSVSQIKTVLVSHNKAKKIAKLENVLGHIKSLVRIDKTIEPLKDDIDKHFEVKDKVGDTIESHRIAMGLSKKRISSSGSEISVNQDDLLRNLESIDIPIQKLNANLNDLNDLHDMNDLDDMDDLDNMNDLDDVNEEMAVVNESIPIDKSAIPNCVVKESPVNNKDDNDAISKKTNKSNVTHEQVTEHDNTSVFYKTKASDTPLNFNKESAPKKDEVFQSYVDSIIRKLKPNDDILDVRLVKEPTNITNEVKIWSKLENFKPHNFIPVHFENEVIDVEDELEFSIIESSPHKHSDPLDTKDETILIDDESNDASDGTLIFNDAINLDAIEKFNDVTITAIDESQNTEVIETADPKVMGPNVMDNIIKEDTIKIGKHLDVRLIETSDAQNKLTKPKSKGRKKCLTKKKDVFNMQKSYENSAEGVKTREDFESIQLSLSDDKPTEATSTWHINNYLQYSEESNERGIFRVIDTEDTADTILRLNDHVDVSLVSKPGSKKDKITSKVNDIKNNDLSITLVNKTIKCVTITPMALPTLTKHQSTFESPKSVKSLTSEGVDYPEGTISDTNIQFLDEYGNDDDCVEIGTLDTRDIDEIGNREDFDQNYMIKEDIDIVEEEVNIGEDIDDTREGTNIRENLDQNDINMIIKEDLDIVEEEINIHEDIDDRREEEANEEDLSEGENSEHVNSDVDVHNLKEYKIKEKKCK